MFVGSGLPMSAPKVTEPPVARTAPSPKPTPADWGAKLTESWPLLVTGGICVAFAVIFALDQPHRTIAHLSPAFLFMAVGVTGIVGGLASFAMGPDTSEPAPRPGPRALPPVQPSQAVATDPWSESPEKWNGRPAPAVVRPRVRSKRPAPTAAEPYVPEEEQAQTDELRLSPESDEELGNVPSLKGRLLHLSEEGNLSVYSLDDALRDLDLIDRVVHERRSRRLGAGTGGPAPE